VKPIFRGLIYWILSDWRHIVITITAPIFIVVFIMLSPNINPNTSSVKETSIPTSEANDPSYHNDAIETNQESKFLPISRKFIMDWLNTSGSQSQWLKRLSYTTTPELLEELRFTELDRVPKDKLSSSKVSLTGQFYAEVTHTLASGRIIVTSVTFDGTSWKVSDLSD